MSVATSTRTAPCLKSASARVRAPWLLLPWIAAALNPSRTSCSASRFAPCFVRVNTSTCRQSPEPMSHDSRSRFWPLSTKYTACSIFSAAALRSPTSTLTGERSSLFASARMSSGNVAENNRFCRLLRQQRDDAANVGQEAHVEHAVGFVEHEDLDVPEIDGALLRMIEQPARCGDENIDAASKLRDLRVDADAAEDDGGS